MRLSKLIASNREFELVGNDVEISSITADSRQVTLGSLFVAIPGTEHDGRTFIEDAVQRGACALLVPQSTSVPKGVAAVSVTDVRQAVSAIANIFYPRQPETVVAVTGTSGKTSTVQFTREIWQALHQPSASIGTLGLVAPFETRYGSLTTPDAITLHALLDECAQKGVSHLALEASSHGLSMFRLDHVTLKAAGFTNLSRDHLDYHQSMESYLAAKQRLFSVLLPTGATAVLNADIIEFEALSRSGDAHGLHVLSYGVQGRELRLIKSLPVPEGQRLTIEVFGKTYETLFPVMGSFQALNGLCALGLVIGSGSDVDTSIAALGSVSGVPGRLQLAGVSPKGGTIFVDYAHKPDALENVLKALRPHVQAHKDGKLGVVFGCGGNRDKGKRPLMGSIAERFSDWAIVTDDNPRREEAASIRAEVVAGFTRSTPIVIGDRALAIAAGIEKMGPHDVVVIAGKGHETGQIVGDIVLPFDDASTVRKVLAP